MENHMRQACATLFLRFLRDEKGATSIEYALIATVIAAGITAIVFGIGASLNNNYYSPVSAALK